MLSNISSHLKFFPSAFSARTSAHLLTFIILTTGAGMHQAMALSPAKSAGRLNRFCILLHVSSCLPKGGSRLITNERERERERERGIAVDLYPISYYQVAMMGATPGIGWLPGYLPRSSVH